MKRNLLTRMVITQTIDVCFGGVDWWYAYVIQRSTTTFLLWLIYLNGPIVWAVLIRP